MNTSKYTKYLFLIAAILSISEYAFASGAAAPTDPLGAGICRIYNVLSGTTARAVAFIVIASVGVGFLFGKASWPTVIITVMGVVIMFGAPTMLNLMTTAGGGTGSSCPSK